MIEKLQNNLKDRLKGTPRATTPRLLVESTWVTFGPPLCLPNRQPDREELLTPSSEAPVELISLDHQI